MFLARPAVEPRRDGIQPENPVLAEAPAPKDRFPTGNPPAFRTSRGSAAAAQGSSPEPSASRSPRSAGERRIAVPACPRAETPAACRRLRHDGGKVFGQVEHDTGPEVVGDRRHEHELGEMLHIIRSRRVSGGTHMEKQPRADGRDPIDAPGSVAARRDLVDAITPFRGTPCRQDLHGTRQQREIVVHLGGKRRHGRVIKAAGRQDRDGFLVGLQISDLVICSKEYVRVRGVVRLPATLSG